MIHTVFPSETVTDLTALSVWLSRQTDDVTVTFSEGEYYGTLTFDAVSCPSVTLTAPNGAVLTGGRTVDCTFQRTSSTVMECFVGAGLTFERLKIDGFTPFAYCFGKDGAPKPNCSLAADDGQETRKITNRYGVFSCMDERLRSATGAASLDGIYVERLRLFSGLKKRGIQKNDVIVSVNGKPFFGTAKEFAVLLKANSEAELIRQQKRTVLK